MDAHLEALDTTAATCRIEDVVDWDRSRRPASTVPSTAAAAHVPSRWVVTLASPRFELRPSPVRDPRTLLQSDEMEMRQAAEAYCEVIEAAEGSERVRFVSDAARTLAAAVAAAYRLPDIEWPSEVDGEASGSGISDDRWARRFSEIKVVVREWGLYWTAPNAYRLSGSTGEPEVNEEFFAANGELRHLADDLADIWRDLRNGLDALDRGASEDEVTWQWRFDFRTHWGAHAVEALRALHQQTTA